MSAPHHSNPTEALAYQTDAWSIGETGIEQARLPQSEALFSVGNGFIGIRGCFEEELDEQGRHPEPPVYLNGVYEVFPIRYHEHAYGFPTRSDSRVPVPDGTAIEIRCGDENFSISEATVLDYRRHLDLSRGLLTRRLRLRWPSGRTVEATFERAAFLALPNLAAIRVRVVALDFSDRITLISSLNRYDPDAGRQWDAADPRIGPRFERDPWIDRERLADGPRQGFVQRTRESGIEICALMAHEASGEPATETRASAVGISHRLSFQARRGQPFTVTKFLAYATDRGRPGLDCRKECDAALERATRLGLDALLSEQSARLERFWDDAGIALSEAPALQTGARLGMLQLLQAAGRDGETSISAKGQTGEGYEGHVFWDAESFALPFFAFNDPEVARSMLVYRHAGLEAAREHARTMGHRRGALYPWRTIGGGECSSYFPAGSAQYHINADIAHAIALYGEVTQDDDFLAEFGAEILVETARLWLEVGYFDPRRDGQFCINRVTGPDEYSALVDNNFYTNAMARENLRGALAALTRLSDRRPDAHVRLLDRLSVSAGETRAWGEAADAMFLPYCEQSGIYLQDDAFLNKKTWDFDGTPPEKYPLLIHFHPLAIYRHQVCKQADAVMALFVLGHQFEPEAIARSFDHYKRVTVHDSTLSPGIFSILASRVGELEDAFDFFRRTVLIDLDNLGGNADHGLHMAAMASVWMAIAYGFGGLRTADGRLGFAPLLLDPIGPYRFRIGYRRRRIEVDVNRERVLYRLLGGEPIELAHHQQAFVLSGRHEARLANAG